MTERCSYPRRSKHEEIVLVYRGRTICRRCWRDAAALEDPERIAELLKVKKAEHPEPCECTLCRENRQGR